MVWLVVQCAHLEKWWSSSMGRMTSHILWKIKIMFETNQWRSVWYKKLRPVWAHLRPLELTAVQSIGSSDHISDHWVFLTRRNFHIFHFWKWVRTWKWNTWCPTSRYDPGIFHVGSNFLTQKMSKKISKVQVWCDPSGRWSSFHIWHLGTFRRYRNERFPWTQKDRRSLGQPGVETPISGSGNICFAAEPRHSGKNYAGWW